MQGVAFFDFDGTISTKDSFLDFIIFCKGRLFFYYGIMMLSGFIFLYYVSLISNTRLKEIFFTFYLSKFSKTELDALGSRYALMKLPSIIKPLALEKIKWHILQQHRVIILTASSPIWLKAWCDLYNIELIGTQFYCNDLNYTGAIIGNNCYGKEKLRYVRNVLSSYPNGSLLSYGYGDSPSDRFFLNELDVPMYKPF